MRKLSASPPVRFRRVSTTISHQTKYGKSSSDATRSRPVAVNHRPHFPNNFDFDKQSRHQTLFTRDRMTPSVQFALPQQRRSSVPRVAPRHAQPVCSVAELKKRNYHACPNSVCESKGNNHCVSNASTRTYLRAVACTPLCLKRHLWQPHCHTASTIDAEVAKVNLEIK